MALLGRIFGSGQGRSAGCGGASRRGACNTANGGGGGAGGGGFAPAPQGGFRDRSNITRGGCCSCMCLGQNGGQAPGGNDGGYGNFAGNGIDAGNGNFAGNGNNAGYGNIAPAAGAAAPAQAGGVPAEAAERQLFDLINRTRQQLGLNPLVYDESLSPVARQSAQARTHTNTGGTSEIIAWGQNSPEGALETWRNSPAHWRILTSPNLTAMGPGWVGDGAGVTFR